MNHCTSYPSNSATRCPRAAMYLGAIAIGFMFGNGAFACPFCSVESQTLSEETQSSDAVVLAKLIKDAPPPSDATLNSSDPNAGTATFQIVEVLRGQEFLNGVKEIQVVFFGESNRERVFLISGIGTEKVEWTTPLPLSAAAVEYVRKLGSVPPSGTDRLTFFQDYLEHEDPLLAQDSYDEFARTPYADVLALGPRMPHDKLVQWIGDPEVSPSRRRLYLTMLGVCGTEEDLPMLEALISSDFQTMKPLLDGAVSCAMAMGAPLGLPLWIDLVDQDERRKKLGLDALVACYLTLRGPDGLDLIDSRFLTNQKTEYTYLYSTIMALRFHGEEQSSPVPRERLLESMRLLLDNPEFADQVIPDLARWEDWSVLGRLVSMFKASDETGYVRQPVVTYLTVASEQPGDVGTRATAALAELEQIDPEGVKQARSLMAFGALGRARASKAIETGSVSTSVVPTSAAASSPPSNTAGASDDAQESTSGDSEFADPADYEEGAAKTADAAAQDNGDGTVAAASAEVASNAKNVSAANASPAASAASEAAEFNRLLVVGVPLGAAVLLVGVYWLILRAGAL